LLFIFILVVILGPLVETFIFQFGVIELFALINKSRFIKVIALFVSSFLFGLSHSSSLEYIIKGTISGFLFSSCYLLAKERKDISPFVLVFIVHASSNLFVFIINELL
jgi:membrane protease YdiL (CAAX protease family)